MMSVYIPEVDRSVDILELIEYPHLLEYVVLNLRAFFLLKCGFCLRRFAANEKVFKLFF